MAVYTPRGLKIGLPVPVAFALMARLYPEVDAFRVLKTTEGLMSIPEALALIAGGASFAAALSPYEIAAAVFIAFLVGKALTAVGLFPPGLPTLGVLYSNVSGFGVLLVGMAVYGFFSVGLQGVVAFFAGKLGASAVELVFEFLRARFIHRKTGVVLMSPEVNFFNAYRLHASRVGKSIDIGVEDEELDEAHWRECFGDLAIKWPVVVGRFTSDDDL